MTKKLDGKIALITGAAQGIGRATALAFAREGAKVWATDINFEKLTNLCEENSAITIHPLNVLQQDAINALSTKLSADILLNCAGFVHQGTIQDCADNDWDFSFDINVKSMFRMIKAFLPGMLKKGGGSILNIASVASSIKGVPNRFVYSTTKAAVIGLTKSVAADFVSQGIRCNAICPGTVQTPSLDERMLALGGDLASVRNSFVARQPMGRLGKPEEIASLALYLASDDAAFTTGTINIIDGGWCI